MVVSGKGFMLVFKGEVRVVGGFDPNVEKKPLKVR
jgi:hypothetical protein